MKIKASELKVGDKILLDWWEPHHAAYITEIDINKIYYTPNWGHNSFFYTHAVESYERLEAFPKIKKVNVEDLKVGDKLQLTWYPEKEDTFKFGTIKNIVRCSYQTVIKFEETNLIGVHFGKNVTEELKKGIFDWDIRIMDECKMLTNDEIKQIAKILKIDEVTVTEHTIKYVNPNSVSVGTMLDCLNQQTAAIASNSNVGFKQVKIKNVATKFIVEVEKEKSIDQLRKEVMEKLK